MSKTACVAVARCCDIQMAVMIHFSSDDGEELEEQWASPDAFHSWAISEGLHGAYSVYEEDEDGDWMLTLKGRIEATE